MTNLNSREGSMLDLKEEQKYGRLRKLGQELHIPIPEHFIELEVRDKDGKVIQRHKQRSHSWVRNAYNQLLAQLAACDSLTADGLAIVDTGGVTKSDSGNLITGKTFGVDLKAAGQGYTAGAADNAIGIVVGSGTNAESFEDDALQTQIAEGAGGGQLNHIASEVYVVSDVGLTKKNTLIRYFNNNGGVSVDVNEVALYIQGDLKGSDIEWCNSRDKLASTVTVPDTGQLKVTYTIQLTYPS